MRSGHTRFGGLTAALASALVISAMVVPAQARTRINQTLAPTTKAPGAQGQAKLHLKTGSRGKFSVKGRHLSPATTFDVVVNKIKVGTLTTSAGGSGVAKFSTTVRGHDQVLGFDPQGDEVEVRDADGDDVLDGEMPDDNPDGGLGCCLGPDHHDEGEIECEDLTEADCAARGGTPAAGGCLPDPCGGTPPPVGVVCCLATSASGAMVDDDPEIECEEADEVDCAAQGGTLVQGTSCDEHPCEPVSPSTVVTCCVPDGNEAECEMLTPEHCTAHGGTANAAASCSGDPCGGGGGHE